MNFPKLTPVEFQEALTATRNTRKQNKKHERSEYHAEDPPVGDYQGPLPNFCDPPFVNYVDPRYQHNERRVCIEPLVGQEHPTWNANPVIVYQNP